MAESLHQTVEHKVRALAEPLLQAEGLELIDAEFLREKEGWVLRLFIDKPGDKVGLDDCTRASNAVDRALEVEDIVPHEYRLEVSSPGLDRPLKKPEHFTRVKGQKIRVKTFGPVGEPPRKNFVGVLRGVDEGGVRLEVEGAGEFQIAFKDMAKANLEFQF
ncbi:MAG: ribosome maturation factor RimP [Myxococcaceae bacterium]